MYNFVVCSVFKNESGILEEWLNHYFFHGVEHIYLVNDFSTDDYMPILNKFSDKITLFHNDIVTKEVGRQVLIYDKYFKSLLPTTKWMSILDMDEFLYSPVEINIQHILKMYEDIEMILIDWVHFGSNKHILQPKSVVEGFTMRASYGKNKPYYGYKCIFQTKYLSYFGIHECGITGNKLRLQYTETSDVPKLLINHYNIQSLEFYLSVKQTRGDINNWFDYQNLKRDEKYFDFYDDNDIQDTRLYEQNKEIITI